MGANRRPFPHLGWGVGIALGLGVAVLLMMILWNGGGRAHGQSLVCSSFGGGPPYAFETYEASRDRIPYLTAQQLAATNQLFTAGSDFSLQEIEVGPFGDREPLAEATIPVPLLNAIGWIESRLNQGSIGVPYEGVGPVLISPSCAYGLMQVASSFSNNADTPSVDEALVGTHYAYNIAEGARILAAKWNAEFFPQLGSSNPFFIESWYYATWAYNGWAFVNHPAGTEVDPFRTPYDCDAPFNGYPYQELVLGCVENPPAPDDVTLWDPFPVALPNLAALAFPGGPLDPDVYFDGWTAVFAAPFTGDDVPTPFKAMNLELPPGAGRGGAAAVYAGGGGVDAGDDLPVARAAGWTNQTSSCWRRRRRWARASSRSTTMGRGCWSTDCCRNQTGSLSIFRPAWLWGRTSRCARTSPARCALRSLQMRRGLGEGLHQGVIIVEAILPDGEVVTSSVTVVVDKQGVPRYEAGTPLS